VPPIHRDASLCVSTRFLSSSHANVRARISIAYSIQYTVYRLYFAHPLIPCAVMGTVPESGIFRSRHGTSRGKFSIFPALIVVGGRCYYGLSVPEGSMKAVRGKFPPLSRILRLYGLGGACLSLLLVTGCGREQIENMDRGIYGWIFIRGGTRTPTGFPTTPSRRWEIIISP